MQELQLFDLEQYTAPPAQISGDGNDDYEDPQYVTPKLWGRDGGKTKVLRFLYEWNECCSAGVNHVAAKTGLPKERIGGMPTTDFQLFKTFCSEGIWQIQLTDMGKAIAKVAVDELPSDAMVLKVKPLDNRIVIEYSVYGGIQSMGISLAKEKRRYRQGWTSLEKRKCRGKYTQVYLHYQTPGEPKRSKYVPASKYRKIEAMVLEKRPIPEILEALRGGSKSL